MKAENSVEKNISLLEGGEVFFDKLLSRDTSNGFSSRIYYRVAVPFDWEIQPGKPKNQQEIGPLPPLSPPPAVLSSQMAQQLTTKSKGGSNRLRLWFKRMKKAGKGQKCPSQIQMQTKSKECTISRIASFGVSSCEGDSMSSDSKLSPSNSSSSMSSSCSSRSSPSATVHQITVRGSEEKQGMEGMTWALGCLHPRNFRRQ